jgi:1-acyl-sn-glycerol-3-phosphate acyltransferase
LTDPKYAKEISCPFLEMNIQPRDALASLTDINLEDMVVAFGWQDFKFGRWFAGILFRKWAEKFSQEVLDFDFGVSQGGLKLGADRMLPGMVQEVRIAGEVHIPENGPVLILSNHPGMSDTLALFSSIPRFDLKVLAAERPFLKNLPETRKYLLFIPEDLEGRAEALRRAASHLRAGGALLTFPAGEIEPDPAVLSGAVESLKFWNPSTGVFVRLVPELTIVPAIVSGVLAWQSLKHPITSLRRRPKDRERLAAALQLIYHEIWPNLWPVFVNVRFGNPIRADELLDLRMPGAITRAIIDRVSPFLEGIVLSDFQDRR